jgi:hypothetical protein
MAAHRVQIELPERSFERLERLRRLTGADPFSELMSNALSLYEFVIDKSEQGATILIQEDGKTPVALKLFKGEEP